MRVSASWIFRQPSRSYWRDRRRHWSLHGKHSPVCEGIGAFSRRAEGGDRHLGHIEIPRGTCGAGAPADREDHRHSRQPRHHLRFPHSSRPAVALLQGPTGVVHCRRSGDGGAGPHTLQAWHLEGQDRGRERVPQGNQRWSKPGTDGS